MTNQQQLTAVAATLSDMGLKELLDFAQFLRLKEETADWRAAARSQFAKAYGDDEPDYTEAGLQTRDSVEMLARSCRSEKGERLTQLNQPRSKIET